MKLLAFGFIFLASIMGLAEPAPTVGLQKDVRATIRQHLKEFKDCYQNRVKTKSDLANGKIVLQWDIETDGSVKTVNISQSAVHDEVVENCLMTQLKALKFKALPSGVERTQVRYPFVFYRTK